MWFVISGHNIAKFYSSDRELLEVKGIEWIKEKKTPEYKISSSKPFIKDSKQAISVLQNAGIKGYRTKSEAKEFAKTLPVSVWRYLKLV